MNMTTFLNWAEHNRFTLAGILLGVVMFMVAVGCTPTVNNPTNPAQQVNARELQTELAMWQMQVEQTNKRFELAAADLQYQQQQQAKLVDAVLQVASGSVADWGGLVQLVIGGGLIGLLGDNIRKGGVIGGLKRNTQ